MEVTIDAITTFSLFFENPENRILISHKNVCNDLIELPNGYFLPKQCRKNILVVFVYGTPFFQDF